MNDNLSIEAMMEMNPAELLDLRDFYAERQAELVKPFAPIFAMIERVIEARFKTVGEIALEKAGKTHGKVSVDLPGGLKLSANVTQRVEWEQDKLKAIASSMPDMEQIAHYFDIGFRVSEKIYKAIPPGPLRQQFNDARIVKLSPLRITLERKDAASAANAAGG